MGQSSTQREKIKEYFWDRFGQWVPLPELLPFAAQYNARICELRRELRPKGYWIFNRTERQSDGTIHSWFRLDYRAAIDATPTKPQKPALDHPEDKKKTDRHANADWFEREFGKRPASKPATTTPELPLFVGVQS